MDMIKPRMRGVIHQIAFIFTCVLTGAYFVTSIFVKHINGLLVYLGSQLLLFGISSTYHRVNWESDKYRRLFQKFDHISIFFLISGSQTGAALIMLPYDRVAKSLIITSWTITLIGALKVLIFRNIYESLDVALYIMHGLAIIPFFSTMRNFVSPLDIILVCLGGLCYIVGGVIFKIKKPALYPAVFGYHEIFHALTVIANIFIMVPIIKKYILLVLESS